jgi:hypothetical protein
LSLQAFDTVAFSEKYIAPLCGEAILTDGG